MIKQMLRHAGALRRRAALLAVMAAALTLGACDGDNLFGGNTAGTGGPPRITQLSAPQQAAENARVDVRVRALAPRGLAKINVRFRGATSEDKEFTATVASKDTVTFDVSVDLPAVLADSVLLVEAYATDAVGAVSDIVNATVRIVDASAPTVTATAVSGQASTGGTFDLHVTASDPFGLKQVGYAFVNAQKDTVLSALIAAAGSQRDTTFHIAIPSTLRTGDISVIALAVNQANLRGVSSPLALTLVDSLAPVVTILEPGEGESFPLNDSLRVRVRASDASGIKSISIRGVSFRFFPDSSRNSFPVTRYPEMTIPLPQGPDRPLTADTTVFRWLKAGADTTSEPVWIIARVTDAQDNVGVDTVRIIPGPRITILNPLTGSTARVNSSLPIRVSAYDPAAGLDSLKVYVEGVQTDSFVYKPLNGTKDAIERNMLLTIGGQTGTLSLRAAVWNSMGIRGGTTQPVVVNVSQQSTSAPPAVQRVVAVAERIELGDSIKIHVIGTDDGGITRLGAVAIVIPQNESALLPRDTFYYTTGTYGTPRGGTPDTTFVLRLRDSYKEVGAARFPMQFTIQVHAFALDAEGGCAASVNEFSQQLACSPLGNGYFVAAGQTGRTYNPTAVVGTSVPLPPRSVIADALADTTNQRVYLSNFSNNRVDVLELRDTLFRRRPILVGSQPWGLFLVPGRGDVDTLMVGNSGGTNISFVPALPGGEAVNLTEDAGRRLLTPNEALFEIIEGTSAGYLRYRVRKVEFSDRPQFVAQDKNKVVLYSTKPTSAATEGTVRYAITDPTPGITTDDPRPEPKIIFSRDALTNASDRWAVARVDSIWVVNTGSTADDQVVLFDHVDGFPELTFSVGPGYPPNMLAAMDTAVFNVGSFNGYASDIWYSGGGWAADRVGFSDTTYVAYSGDLRTVGFGEGDQAPYGRIVLWTASPNPAFPEAAVISANGTGDLIGNAAERVMGLALNQDGTIGVGRGLNSTYFFTNNVKKEGELRLNGIFSSGVAGGNGGVALHPYHRYNLASGTTEYTVAFIATGSKTIKIVDTFHYFEVGEIAIRDNIVGQLRAAPAPPAANAGLAVTSCDYTVAQLYGVTATSNVVIVNVRRKDMLKDPARTCTTP